MLPAHNKKHRGVIGTDHGRNYAVKNLAGAVADPAISQHCKISGGLLPDLEKSTPTPALLRSLLKGMHPESGHQLKPVTNNGTRLQRGREVSNVCYGFDVPLTVSKSISVAALVLGDVRLRDQAYDAMSRRYQHFATLMDRREPRRGDGKAVLPTGLALVVEVPEKADRFGHPHLHKHGYFANLTAYQDRLIRRYCAAHFGRIAREAATAQRHVDRELYRKLKRLGYPVSMHGNRCELDSIPHWLVEKWTAPVPPDMEVNWLALSDPDRKTERRRLDDAYILTRSPKTYQPLSHWQLEWESEIGPRQMARVAKTHFDSIRPPSRVQIPIQRVAAATDHADDTQDVLQPISKEVLLGALPRGHQPPARGNPPPNCDELIAVSRNWAIESISQDLRCRAPSSPRRIEVHGSGALTPWFEQFVLLLGLSFPGARVVPRHAALARPQVRVEPAHGEFATTVVRAAAYFAEQLQKTRSDELRRLNQLLRLGRENTQCLRANHSMRITVRQTARPGVGVHTPEIHL